MPNPAAGKRPANARTTSRTRAHTRSVNGKTVYVRASTRTRDWAHSAWTSVNATRIRRTAAGTATAGTVSALIVAEFGFTLVTTLAMAGIALLTGAAVFAGSIAETNKKTMNAQKRRRAAKPRTQRTTTRRTTQRRGRTR